MTDNAPARSALLLRVTITCVLRDEDYHSFSAVAWRKMQRRARGELCFLDFRSDPPHESKVAERTRISLIYLGVAAAVIEQQLGAVRPPPPRPVHGGTGGLPGMQESGGMS